MSFAEWLKKYVGISWAYYDNNYSDSQAYELWEEYLEFLNNQEEQKNE